MNNLCISLIPDAPKGFVYREPSKRDLLESSIILFTDSVDRCTALLDRFYDRVVGMIIVNGTQFSYRELGSTLWLLTIPSDRNDQLLELANSFISHIELLNVLQQHNQYLENELKRANKESTLSQSEYRKHTRYLGKQVQALGREIRIRKETEVQLALFRSFAEASQQGVDWINSKNEIIYTNPAAKELLGGNRIASTEGQIVTEFYPPKEQERLLNEILPTVMKNGSWQGELLVRRPTDHEEIPTHNSIVLLAGKDSNEHYIANIVTDLRGQKKAEEERVKIKKLESIGMLAGGIAHDFNNLLTSILGNLDLALTTTNATGELQELLEVAKKSSLRAKTLTQQLLTFAKGGDPIREIQSIAPLIQENINFLLRGKETVCHCQIQNDLWSADIDSGQIIQVLQNLILNASEAMNGAGTLIIRAHNIEEPGNPPAQHIEIKVTDHGKGIPPEHLDKIFDPYFSTKDSGHGLGLAISHSIITKHGGQIFVESEPANGTTITIRLPPAKPSTPKRQELTPNATTNENKKNALRILVMDDETMIRNISSRILSRLGHEVFLASDGAEAISLYQEQHDEGNPIDLMLMDLTIPQGLGGKEALEAIHSRHPNAVAIVSSGYSSSPIMSNYADYGFSAAIAKPFEIAQLKKTINRVIEEKSSLPNPA